MTGRRMRKLNEIVPMMAIIKSEVLRIGVFQT
jgi:hypothetical protein